MAQSIRDEMRADLVAAVKAREAVAVSVLRTTLAALSNAEAVDPLGGSLRAGLFGDVERRLLSAAEIRAIVAGERDALLTAAVHFDRAGRATEATRCRRQAEILGAYLAT